MSVYIRYQVQPKEVDTNGNELELEQYTIESAGDASVKYVRTLSNADKYVDLPVIADHTSVEFISNQDVYFSICDSSGTQLLEIEACRNLVLKATLNYTYQIKNISGDDADVIWRLYL
uniref:Uncharacterized protein n=1 Tax=viral metagenome TaxID=1070528 RepID=A0A6M3M5J0_9ZZZZ